MNSSSKKLLTRENQEQRIHRVYLLFLVLGILLLGFSALWCSIVLTPPTSQDFKEISAYEHEWIEDISQPYGGIDVVTFVVTSSDEDSNLTFYPIHQAIRLYEEDQLIYSLELSDNSIWGRSPGHDWISVSLTPGQHSLRLELIPVYESSKGVVPILYIGSEWGVYHQVLTSEGFIFMLALIAIFVGIVFIVWYGYSRISGEVPKNILYLGEFAIIISIWKLTDLQMIDLVAPYRSWLAMLTLFALYFAIVPFVLFMQTIYTIDFSRLFNYTCYLSLLFLAFNMVGQVLNLCDVRENLTIGHAIIVIVIILCFGCAAYEIKKKGPTRRMVGVLICLILCFVGTIVDMVIYYAFKGAIQYGLGMLAFDICIISLGIMTMKSGQALIIKGREAGRFENLAFHDELTDLFSRAAYVDYIESKEFGLENATLFMFDLNNLKKYNDNYGHEAGDNYLHVSAGQIKKVFEEHGKCFRMGGDEFCCIIDSVISDQECEALIQTLRTNEDAYNAQHTERFPMQIACGYAKYQKGEDYDISDTLRRADKRMYADKQRLKTSGITKE